MEPRVGLPADANHISERHREPPATRRKEEEEEKKEKSSAGGPGFYQRRARAYASIIHRRLVPAVGLVMPQGIA